jgi:hypothetical protein
MNKRSFFVFLSMSGLILLSACSPKMTLDYSAKTTAEIKGTVNVTSFRYNKPSDIQDDEVVNTALTGRNMSLTQSVSGFVTTAVRREFRQAGISLRDAHCTLEGEVNKYNYSVSIGSSDYASEIHYVLKSPSNNVLYNNVIQTSLEAGLISKESLIDNFNKVISDNIDKLLNDSSFASAVEKNCSP